MTAIITQEATKSMHDTRPDDFTYALMSNHVYSLPKVGDVLSYGETKYPSWVVKMTKNEATGWFKSGYFSALYYNQETDHYVLAHRGTNDIGGIWEDFRGIFAAANSKHKELCFKFVQNVIDEIIKKETTSTACPRISFTGHSLGAFLSEMSIYICSMNRYNLDLPHVNAVTFESPGSLQSMEAWSSSMTNEKIDFTLLDIVSYASYPNVINTFDSHVGTLYHVKPEMEGYKKFSLNPAKYTIKSHSMDGLVKTFHGNPQPNERVFVLSWPKGIEQQQGFFKNYKLEGSSYVPKDEAFSVYKEMIGAGYNCNENVSSPAYMQRIQFSPPLFKALLGISKWVSIPENSKLIDEWSVDEKDEIEPLMKENLKHLVVANGRSGEVCFLVLMNQGSIFNFREWVSRSVVMDSLLQLVKETKAKSNRTNVSIVSGNAKVKEIRDSSAVAYEFPDSYNKDVIQEMIDKNPMNVAIADGNCEIDLLSGSKAVGLRIEQTMAMDFGFGSIQRKPDPPLMQTRELQIKTDLDMQQMLGSLNQVAAHLKKSDEDGISIEIGKGERVFSIASDNDDLFIEFKNVVENNLSSNNIEYNWKD